MYNEKSTLIKLLKKRFDPPDRVTTITIIDRVVRIDDFCER